MQLVEMILKNLETKFQFYYSILVPYPVIETFSLSYPLQQLTALHITSRQTTPLFLPLSNDQFSRGKKWNDHNIPFQQRECRCCCCYAFRWLAADIVESSGVLRPHCIGALFTGCTFAPLIKSHNINATSPSMAGKAILKTRSLYCGNSKPVKLKTR